MPDYQMTCFDTHLCLAKEQAIADRKIKTGRGKGFKPNRDFVKEATKDFLANGGKINHLPPSPDSRMKEYFPLDRRHISEDVVGIDDYGLYYY